MPAPGVRDPCDPLAVRGQLEELRVLAGACALPRARELRLPWTDRSRDEPAKLGSGRVVATNANRGDLLPRAPGSFVTKGIPSCRTEFKVQRGPLSQSGTGRRTFADRTARGRTVPPSRNDRSRGAFSARRPGS